MAGPARRPYDPTMHLVEPQPEDFLRLHQTVLEWVAREADPDKILADLCGLVGDLIPGGLCAVMALEPDAGTLSVDVAPGVIPELVQALADLAPGEGSGSCGNAVRTGQAVFCADTRVDARWDSVRSIAEQYGIRACWSVPIFSHEGEILGTFSISHSTPGGPTPGQEQLVRTGGSLAGIVVARRRMRESLRKQERLVDAILQGTEDAIFAKDVEGRYLLANSSLARTLGHSPDEILGTTDQDYFDPEHAAAIEERDRSVFESGRALQYEFELPGPEGSSLTFLLSKTPLRKPSGEISGLIGIGRDVTALRRTQVAVQESQRLESLGVLTGGIAHDFNNLLTGVLGHAELALSRSAGDPRTEVSLQEISRAASRASGLIEQMLAYAGQREGAPRLIDLSDFVADSSALLNASVAKQAELLFDVPPGVGSVRADPLQLQQVLMSVLTNASEALDGRPGSIRVRIRRLAPGLARPAAGDTSTEAAEFAEGTLAITVEDQGCGISPEVLPHIFDPFFSTKFSGRGLGLAAARGIIHAHGGCVDVESEAGQGTVFKLYLPAVGSSPECEEPRGATALLPDPVAPEKRGLILVADDEEVVRSLSVSVLEGAGYEVLTAADGEAAVSLVAERGSELALAILDRSMPLLSGREAFVKIREHSSRLGVVLSSGYSESQATADFVPGDLVGYLEKPYRPARLLAVVHAALCQQARDRAASRP